MNRSKGLARAAALVVVSLVLSLAIPLFPSLATSSNDIALGTTSNFSLVSGGVIVLGASAKFTGASSVQTALVAAVDLDSPTVVSYTAAGVTNFIQNTAPASTALSDAIALRSQLDSLTGVTRNAVLGNETITAGVYDALSGTAISIATPLVLDGGGDYNSIFVFRTPAAFNVAADLTIQAVNGAQPSHIFWVIAGAITIGARTAIPGTFISPTAITIGANDVINGSLLGTTAAAITIGASAVINHSTRTSLTSWSSVTKNYGDASFAAVPPAVIGSISGTFSYASETTTVISVSGSTFNVTGVGSTRITTTFTPTNGFLYYTETATMVISVGLGNQVITWAPNTSVLTTATPLTPSSLASRLDTATVTYSVTSAGTTGCSIDSVTAVLSFTAVGNCVTAATAAPTSLYESATV
jgi:Ice-binding-like